MDQAGQLGPGLAVSRLELLNCQVTFLQTLSPQNTPHAHPWVPFWWLKGRTWAQGDLLDPVSIPWLFQATSGLAHLYKCFGAEDSALCLCCRSPFRAAPAPWTHQWQALEMLQVQVAQANRWQQLSPHLARNRQREGVNELPKLPLWDYLGNKSVFQE